MYGMNKSELRLMPHDVSWQDDFLAEREPLESTVADSSIRIEHIGNTAIPNVCAKPILDIARIGAKGFKQIRIRNNRNKTARYVYSENTLKNIQEQKHSTSLI